MKKRAFLLFLACAVCAALFTGCDYNGEAWTGKVYSYIWRAMGSRSDMKNIDSEHREVFESAFNNIEIFGARLCVPMKAAELPDKFELSNSFGEYVPLSEDRPSGGDIGGGLKRYRLYLYYDREIRAANVYVICRSDQSIEEGVIYEIEFDILAFQPALLGGRLDVHSDVDEIKEFFGEGNEFREPSVIGSSSVYELVYTDGNKLINFSYGVQGDDENVLICSIGTYNVLS